MSSNLRDLAIRLQSVIDTAIDGIITIDDQGIIETINMAGAQLFDYQKEEVVGKNIKMLMPEPYRSNHDGYIDRYKKTKEARIVGIGREVVGRKKNGDTFPFRLAVSEVVLNDRVIFTGIIHDLTDVKAAEERWSKLNEDLEEKVELRTNELEKVVNKLLNTNEKLVKSENELKTALSKEIELNELKSRFVSMASHEFRTPLSTILSSISLIAKYDTTEHQPQREKHVERVKSAVSNLTGILNDFLSLSKIEEGKIELQPENVSLEELCLLVIDEIQGLLKSGQQLNVDKKGERIELVTDKKVLKNVLFNLLSNAIKYSPENGVIRCSISENPESVSFKIIDDGIGIPEAEQKHLFSRFFRASNVENIQGTGLGLNIVRNYLRLIGGKISFTSVEGQGSEFLVTIPKFHA